MGVINEWRSERRFNPLTPSPSIVNSEPFHTPFDLRFVLFGFSIRVQALFWLLALFICAGNGIDAGTTLLTVCAFFLSILVHELGHTFAFRHYGIASHIVLYWMGGLAIPGSHSSSPWETSYNQPRRRSKWQGVIISFAGPAAGFGLAAVVALLVVGTGGKFGFLPVFPFFWSFELAKPMDETNQTLYAVVSSLLFFNIFYGLLNLLPVLPLDGGQIARELFMMNDPYEGQNRAFLFSTIVAVAAGVGSFAIGLQFGGFLFLSLAYSSYMAWSQMRGGGGRGW